MCRTPKDEAVTTGKNDLFHHFSLHIQKGHARKCLCNHWHHWQAGAAVLRVCSEEGWANYPPPGLPSGCCLEPTAGKGLRPFTLCSSHCRNLIYCGWNECHKCRPSGQSFLRPGVQSSCPSPWGTCIPMVLGHLGLARFTKATCLTGRLDLPLAPLYLMAPLPQDSQRSFPDF